jgi:hypothetical protein
VRVQPCSIGEVIKARSVMGLPLPDQAGLNMRALRAYVATDAARVRRSRPLAAPLLARPPQPLIMSTTGVKYVGLKAQGGGSLHADRSESQQRDSGLGPWTWTKGEGPQ